MLFRLDFTQTSDGKLLVDLHASDPGRPHPGKNSCAVLFSTPETLRGLIAVAELDLDTAGSLIEAVRVAESQPETPTCCLQADLSPDQLDNLNMTPALDLYAH